jgi:hypothetical protein
VSRYASTSPRLRQGSAETLSNNSGAADIAHFVNVRIALGKAAATFDLQSAITAVEKRRIVGDGCAGPKAIIVQLWRGRPCGRPLVRLGRAPPARTLIDLVAVDDLPKLDALAAIEGLHEPIQGGA